MTTDHQSRPIKIMQIGGGNFIRGFFDWMIQKLHQETSFNGGVAMVKVTADGNYEKLRSQNGRFHVVLEGSKEGLHQREVKEISIIDDIINVYHEWHDYLNLATNPEIKIITSNTTEAGIQFNSSDIGSIPKHYPGKLAKWLHQRFTHFNGDTSKGCLILPLELIHGNGKRLKECILQYADIFDYSPVFTAWLYESCSFHNTLVDRIITGFPEKMSSLSTPELKEDKCLVMGESYHSWTIEKGDTLLEILPFHHTNLNVNIVDDIDLYHTLKVRILNGAHTALVPIGLLMGYETVEQAITDKDISIFILDLLNKEISPTLPLSNEEVNEFIADTLLRFSNPSIQHRLSDISLNSLSKWQARLLPSFREYYKLKKSIPKNISTSLAALLLLYAVHSKNSTFQPRDNKEHLSLINKAWGLIDGSFESFKKTITIILSNQKAWGEDLTIYQNLENLIAEQLYGWTSTALFTIKKG